MFVNGAAIGMEAIIIKTAREIIRKERRQALTACSAAVAGAALPLTAVWPIATAGTPTAATIIWASDWFLSHSSPCEIAELLFHGVNQTVHSFLLAELCELAEKK